MALTLRTREPLAVFKITERDVLRLAPGTDRDSALRLEAGRYTIPECFSFLELGCRYRVLPFSVLVIRLFEPHGGPRSSASTVTFYFFNI
jgi:hypothetical protein